MDHESTTKGTIHRRRAARLAREMAALVGRLAQALAASDAGNADPGTRFSSSATGAGPMSPHQQAMLWSYALFLARCTHVSNDGGRSFRSWTYPQPLAGSCDHQQFAQLQEAWRRRTDVAQVLDALRDLLAATDIEHVLHGIDPTGNSWRSLVAFFEILLACCDPTSRRRHGVYFTPYPLVRYIVHSVDLLLRRDLGIKSGLVARQPDLRIVDPACGSGAFLLGVLDQARQTLLAGEGQRAWQDFAAQTFLDRLTGIDVLPACCGAVEMLVGGELAAMRDTNRPRRQAAAGSWRRSWSAYCGSPLQDDDYCKQLFAGRVPVILGNPPYNNFGRKTGVAGFSTS